MPLFLPTGTELVDKARYATQSMYAWMRDLTNAFNTSNGFAPADATYFLRSSDTSLPNARVGTNSATVTLDYSTPGQVAWTAISAVPLHTSTTAVTNAEWKALPTTVKQVVAAPGSGFVLIPLLVIIALRVVGGATYANITAGSQAGFSVLYGAGAVDGTNYYSFWNGDGFIAVLTPFVSVPDAAALLAAYPGEQNNNVGGADNLALNLFASNAAGNYTGGGASNTASVTVIYTIFNIATGALS